MSEQGKQGFRINTTIDVGHIITALLLLGGLFTMYRGNGEAKVAQSARIDAIERATAIQEKSLVDMTATLKTLSENQSKLAIVLDMQIQRWSEDHGRIRDIEKSRSQSN